MKRVLVTSYAVPGSGGAASNAYGLFAQMQRDGTDAHYLSIVERIDLPFLQWRHGSTVGNPEHLPQVSICVVETPIYRRHPALVEAVARIAPDVVIARGYIAALVVKTAAPQVPVVLSVAGSQHVEFLIATGRASQAVEVPRFQSRNGWLPTSAPGRETTALAAVDLVLTNSELTRTFLMELRDPSQTCKVYPEPIWGAEWVAEAVTRAGVHAKPFAERGIDLLFVAESWQRPTKSLPMVERLARRLAGRRIALVGECDVALPGVEHLSFITDRRELLAIFADAKAVVVPSLVDACPNVVFEASLMGCNVVTSKNCGNWMLCHEALLVDPPCEDGYVAAAERAVRESYADNMAWFLEQRSYALLQQIIEVL